MILQRQVVAALLLSIAVFQMPTELKGDDEMPKEDLKNIAQRLAAANDSANPVELESAIPKILKPIVKRLGSKLPGDHPSRKSDLPDDLTAYLEHCIPSGNRHVDAGKCVELVGAKGIVYRVKVCERTPVGLDLGFFPIGHGNGYPVALSMHDNKVYELGATNVSTPEEMVSESTCLGELQTFLQQAISGKSE